MKKFAVIGHPVSHSLSPVMHEANFRSLGIGARYSMIDASPGDLGRVFGELREQGYSGLNITIPYKMDVVGLLDRYDDDVSFYGACNCVRFEEDASASGFNTDASGFLGSLSSRGVSLGGRKVFIAGCGGAGRTLAFCAARQGAGQVMLASRGGGSARSLAAELSAAGFTAEALEAPSGDGLGSRFRAWGDCARDADIVVNATPLGLKETDEALLPSEAFRPGQFVLDIIPVRRFPQTAAAAAAAGADAADGIEFLVRQGAGSFSIWTGLSADIDAMSAAARGQEGGNA